MDFLVNSVASKEGQNLLGVFLAHYDLDEYTSRSVVEFYDMDSFRTYYEEHKDQAKGYRLEKGNILYSDTVVRSFITDDSLSLIKEEYASKAKRSYDLIDLVLHGIKADGFVIPNYSSEVPNIYIPFDTFRVSASSFNIYASYKNLEEEFRTFSLLNVEDGSKREFCIAIPQSYDLSMFEEYLEKLDEVSLGEFKYNVFKVDLGLSTYYTTPSEGLLNFLAYMVGYCLIGEKTLLGLSPKITTVRSDIKKESIQTISKRSPKYNVSIKHCCNTCKLAEITKLLEDRENLERLISGDAEANITYKWIASAYNSQWYKECDGNSEEAKLLNSCMNLLDECKRSLLKFGLELLSYRYSIFSMGYINDTLGTILQGGGVYGQSIKRFGV